MGLLSGVILRIVSGDEQKRHLIQAALLGRLDQIRSFWEGFWGVFPLSKASSGDVWGAAPLSQNRKNFVLRKNAEMLAPLNFNLPEVQGDRLICVCLFFHFDPISF